MTIELRSLRYFVAMATTGSITRAAQQVHIAQPALSLHLKAMEAELGVKLFERIPRGVVTTAAGQRFLAHAKAILEHVRVACEDAREEGADPVGSIAVGLPQSIGMALTTPLVAQVLQRWPRLKLQMIETPTGDVPARLASRHIDLGATFLKTRNSGLHYRRLVDEELVLVSAPLPGGLGKRGRSARTRPPGQIAFRQLAEYPLLLPSPPHSLRQLLEQYAHQAQIKLNVIADVDSIFQLTALVNNGMGHTILSYPSVADAVADGRVRVTHLVNPQVIRTVHLCRLASVPRTHAMTAIEDLLVATAQSLAREGRWPGRVGTA